MTDWRLPANRRTAFLRLYAFHLRYKAHPGAVYSLLPAIAREKDLDADQRAWLVWLNGNTQNPAMSLLLLEAAPTHHDWEKAVAFWNEHFKLLDWDTDRRHQKSKFGIATEQWADLQGLAPAAGWYAAGRAGWDETWKHAFGHPYMGRLSAWSMTEYARILLGTDIPDAATLMVGDAGSSSHRNGLAVVAGQDAAYWSKSHYTGDHIIELERLGESLLGEVQTMFVDGHPDATRLTLESALCTFKSWFKPNRRYANVYSDMTYNRLRKAESRFGHRFDMLWDARRADLPPALRLEDNPEDPGLVGVKQNHFRLTGETPMMWVDYPEMRSSYDDAVQLGLFGDRKDPYASR